jgi:two-component system, OmpR family, response regulator
VLEFHAEGVLLAEHIVIVDDDQLLRHRLAAYLEGQGFRVTAVEGAAAMRDVVRRERIDLALIDLTMPGENGLSLTRFLREQEVIGIVILTGRGHPVDRAVGLELGADDYVAKPFHLRELLARIRSVLRRTASRSPGTAVLASARFAGWRLDLARRTLTSADREEVHLTDAEFQLLAAFVGHPNQVLGRDRLLEIVAGRRWSPYDRTVDQHISRLRRKIEADPRQPQLIKSVRGQGYVFTATLEQGR